MLDLAAHYFDIQQGEVVRIAIAISDALAISLPRIP